MSTLPAGWPEGPLVGAGWLLRHIDGVRVLDASVTRIPVAGGATQFAPGDAAFAQAHIPGARPADLFEGFSDPAAPFPALPLHLPLRRSADPRRPRRRDRRRHAGGGL